MSSINHKPPDYKIFSSLISPPTSYTKISSVPFSNALTPTGELELQYGNLYAAWVGI